MCKVKKVLITQLCPALCDPTDYSPPGSYGISQARILEWVAFPAPGGLPNPGIEPEAPASQGDSLPLNHQGSQRNNTHTQTWSRE